MSPRLLALCCLLLALRPTAAAPQTVAVIESREMASFSQIVKSLRQYCGAGKITRHSLKGKKKNGGDIARKVRAAAPDLVLALGPLAAQVAKSELGDIPVLYCMVSNPQRYDLAGANIAGIPLDVPGAEQFARYLSVVPDLRAIGVIYDPAKSAGLVAEAQAAAAKLGLELVATPVSSPKEVPGALRGMLGRIDALWTVPDDTVLTTDSFRHFLVTSFKHKLPFLAISDIFVKVGALATITPAPDDLGRQLCLLIDRIVGGQLDLAQVDILPPGAADLVINLKTADKIGLDIPQTIIDSAGKLYQ